MRRYLIAAVVVALNSTVTCSSQEMFVFEMPTMLPPPINEPVAWDSTATVSPNGLTMYFTTDRRGPFETWVADRSNVTEEFSDARRFNEFAHPNISDNGLSLVMNDLTIANDIFIATRASDSEPFGQLVSAGAGVNSSEADRWPSLSHDELELYFSRNPADDSEPTDVWVAARPDGLSDFGQAERLSAPVNLPESWENHPTLSPDGLALFFSSNRPGGLGGYDIWVSFRDDISSSWGEPLNLGPEINSRFPLVTGSQHLESSRTSCPAPAATDRV